MNDRVTAVDFRHSLRARILFVTSLLFGLTSGAVVYNSIRVIDNVMLENVHVAEQQTSEILHLAAAPFAISGDFETLDVFLDETLRWENHQYGLIYFVIGRENGELLLQSGSINLPLPDPDTQENYSQAVKRGIVHIRRSLLLNDNSVGFMQYGMSFESMVEASLRLNRENILLILGGLMVVSGVLLFIILKIVRRMNVLAKISMAIAEGNYSHRVPEQGKDEISQLALNFNRMADVIQQRIQEITQLNQNLEYRVEARTHDLKEMNATLQETIENLKWAQENLIRSEKMASLGSLVAGVAHELNTPIGNALTVASTHQDHTRTVNDEFQTALRRATLEKYLQDANTACELIVRNLHRAADLMTSFKHVAVDQTSENRREFELHTTLSEITATLSPMLKKTPYMLELQIPENITMNSYPGAIGQILTNLVDNAVKHAFAGQEQGKMIVSASRMGNEKVLLEFSDNGMGMPPDTVKRIFDPFFTTKLGQGGSGLGMSIVFNLT
ncbi:MAG: ATP-binding protein, partial [Gammaproteobacteria bacterium]